MYTSSDLEYAIGTYHICACTNVGQEIQKCGELTEIWTYTCLGCRLRNLTFNCKLS